MNHSIIQMPDPRKSNGRSCLSCGAFLKDRRRRYCSNHCRGKLRRYLNRRTGLLVALNTRYATFYFDSFAVVMDILPYGTDQIFSFAAARTPGKKPVDDFRDMAHLLGSIWWSEKNRTRKRYLASLHVLDRARRVDSPLSMIIPKSMLVPAVKMETLKILCLDIHDLGADGLKWRIKSAYRRQAKIHHPDTGGEASRFRRIQEAYEKLIHWSQNPTYLRYSGFPDKWLYEGSANRWLQPAAMRRLNN